MTGVTPPGLGLVISEPRFAAARVSLGFPRLAGPVVAVALAAIEITAAGCSRSELTAATAANQDAGRAEAPVDVGMPIPGNLEECFAELTRVLPRATIEQMQGGSEAEMARHHLGLGMWMRNQWGLWRGSRLRDYFNGLGVHHPDDMSGIILTSFWRHLHGEPLRLDEQIRTHQAYWEWARRQEGLEQQRAERAIERIHAMMMGLTLAEVSAPTVALPDRSTDGLRARYLARYRGGILVAVRGTVRGDGAFQMRPYFLDLQKLTLHPIVISEIDVVWSTVVVAEVGYFLGEHNGRPLLAAVGANAKQTIPLPRSDAMPQLGLDGERVLAVYRNAVYRLDGDKWSLIHQGTAELPRSGPPPLKFDTRIYFRDEGHHEDRKRFWWLDLGSTPPRLVSLDKDVGIVGPSGPRWEDAPSYAVTPGGDLWVAVGNDRSGGSLLKRSSDGAYQVAIVNGANAFDGNLLKIPAREPGIAVSAIVLQENGLLLGAGPSGLYRIGSTRIERLVSFKNTSQKIPWDAGRTVYHWRWDPSGLLDLGLGRYLISGMFGGIYLLQRQGDGGFALVALDETIEEPVTL